MNRFTLKLIIAFAIFLIPAGYFQYMVAPNVTGGIGRVGMIPFGKEEDGLDVKWYQRDKDAKGTVINIYNPDDLKRFHTITVGDSFSQYSDRGYQYSLSYRKQDTIANFKGFQGCDLLRNYLLLLKGGYLTEGQTVILESVERSIIKRFYYIDLLEPFRTIPIKKENSDNYGNKPSILSNYLFWLRLRAGYETPVRVFSLSKACFTHDRFSNVLHIFNNERIGDGDLLWNDFSEKDYTTASLNIKKMFDLSEEKGIILIILIACDKYDAYEPWIVDPHEKNPTLDNIPRDNRIFSTRDCLRDAIDSGVKDVYKLNDSHWSVVGADIVGNKLYEWMTNKPEAQHYAAY